VPSNLTRLSAAENDLCQLFLASKSPPSSSHVKSGGYMKAIFGDKKQKFVHSPSHSDSKLT